MTQLMNTNILILNVTSVHQYIIDDTNELYCMMIFLMIWW